MVGEGGGAEGVDMALACREKLMISQSSSRVAGVGVIEMIASNTRACTETVDLLLIVNLPG
jgi:hypothetical protein